MPPLTDERGYPYPSATDNINPPADFEALASAIDDDVQDVLTPTVTTTVATVGTVAAGFTANGARAATMLAGKLVEVSLNVTNTAGITATTGNITDTQCFTLATAYRPSDTVTATWGNGSVSGECTINTDGTVFLRSADGSIGAGSSALRIHAMYIRN